MPVRAWPIRSWPLSASGIASAWIGNGVVMPWLARVSAMSSDTPSSAKVFMRDSR